MNDMDNIAVSVVVPSYNSGKFLQKTIRSLLAQDFNKPYEIIVVDDGSVDGSTDDLENLNDKVTVYRQANEGAANARNKGVKLANAPVVVFHDAGDLAHKNKISAMYNALKNNKECVASIGISINSNYGKKKLPFWAENRIDGSYITITDPLKNLFNQYHPLTGVANVCAYKSVLMQVTSDRSFYKVANDYDMQIRLAEYGSFVAVRTITTTYRFHKSGLTSTYGFQKQMCYALISALEVYHKLENKYSYKYI